MTISKVENGEQLTIRVEGRLDINSASDLEKELANCIKTTNTLVFDFAGLEYISSAGLRVLLSAQKVMNTRGSMKIINTNETINEIFEVTGFVAIMAIE